MAAQVRSGSSRSVHLAIALLLTLAPSLRASAEALEPPVLIDNVRLVDGDGGRPLDSAAILIVDGRIARIDSAGTIDLPDGGRRINGSGKTLIPGLIDTHAHVTLGPVEMDLTGPAPVMRVVTDESVPEASLRSLLSHGVTTIRDPGGETSRVVATREAISSGDRVGPRMLVAGSLLDRSAFEGLTTAVNSEEDIRREIRAQAAAGVDFIKLYVTLTPDLMAAAIDEAERQGLGTIAHTLLTTWTEAAELGVDSLVHILPGSPALLPEEHRSSLMQDMTAGTQFMLTWFEYADLDSPEIEGMIEAIVQHSVSVDPTLVMWETMVRGDDPAVIESPDLELVPASMVENWSTSFNMNLGWTPSDFDRGRLAFKKALQLARRLHEAGVMLTAGSDANNPWVVPGPSLHRELELLVAAGLDPLEVLTIATKNGASVLGVLDEVGTLKVGKQADMVLLDADPSIDISATRSIVWVMRAGSILPSSQAKKAAGSGVPTRSPGKH